MISLHLHDKIIEQRTRCLHFNNLLNFIATSFLVYWFIEEVFIVSCWQSGYLFTQVNITINQITMLPCYCYQVDWPILSAPSSGSARYYRWRQHVAQWWLWVCVQQQDKRTYKRSWCIRWSLLFLMNTMQNSS